MLFSYLVLLIKIWRHFPWAYSLHSNCSIQMNTLLGLVCLCLRSFTLVTNSLLYSERMGLWNQIVSVWIPTAQGFTRTEGAWTELLKQVSWSNREFDVISSCMVHCTLKWEILTDSVSSDTGIGRILIPAGRAVTSSRAVNVGKSHLLPGSLAPHLWRHSSILWTSSRTS